MIQDKWKNRTPRVWTRAEKLILAAVVLFLLNLLFAVVIETQVQTRNRRLDQFSEAIHSLDMNVADLKISTKKIEAVAEDVSTPDPANQAQLKKVFEQIEGIYQVIVNQEDIGGP